MEPSNNQPGARRRPADTGQVGSSSTRPLARRRLADPAEPAAPAADGSLPPPLALDPPAPALAHGPLLSLAAVETGGHASVPAQATPIRSRAQYAADLAQSIRSVADAYARDPCNFSHVRDAARTLSHLGDFAAAQQVLSWHLELNPDDGHAGVELTFACLQAGALDAAISANLQSIARHNIGVSDIHIALLSGADRTGLVDRLAPQAVPMLRAMDALLTQKESPRTECRQAFAAAWSQIPTWADKARVWAFAQDTDKALECLQMAIRSGELPLNLTHCPFMRPVINQPQVLALLRGVGEAPEQLRAIGFTIRTPRRVFQARQRQSECVARLASMAQAAQDAFHANPHDLQAVADASRMLMILGRLYEADALLDWHASLHPEGGAGHVELARLLVRLDKLDEARGLEACARANGYDGPFFNQISPFMGEFAYLGGDTQDPDVLLARALNWRNRPEPRFQANESDAEGEGDELAPVTRARDEAYERLCDRDKVLYATIWDSEPSRIARCLESAVRNGPLPLGLTHLGLMDVVSDNRSCMALLTRIGEAPEQLAAIAFDIRLPADALGTPEAQEWHVARFQDQVELLLGVYRRQRNDDVMHKLVWMLADTGQPDKAEQLVRWWRGKPLAGAARYEDLARLQWRMRQFDAAHETALLARSMGAGDDVLAELHLLDDGYVEARQLLEGSGKWMELAMVEYSLGNLEASSAAIGRITSPRDKGLAWAWRGADFVPEAIECWQEAVRLGQLPLRVTFSPWLREVDVHPDVQRFLSTIGESPDQLAALRLNVRVN
jgi:hypothetical protein